MPHVLQTIVLPLDRDRDLLPHHVDRGSGSIIDEPGRPAFFETCDRPTSIWLRRPTATSPASATAQRDLVSGATWQATFEKTR